MSDGNGELVFELPRNRRVVVRCRWYLSGNVPVLGPPKPKGIYCDAGVDDDVRFEVAVEMMQASSAAS